MASAWSSWKSWTEGKNYQGTNLQQTVIWPLDEEFCATMRLRKRRQIGRTGYSNWSVSSDDCESSIRFFWFQAVLTIMVQCQQLNPSAATGKLIRTTQKNPQEFGDRPTRSWMERPSWKGGPIWCFGHKRLHNKAELSGCEAERSSKTLSRSNVPCREHNSDGLHKAYNGRWF